MKMNVTIELIDCDAADLAAAMTGLGVKGFAAAAGAGVKTEMVPLEWDEPTTAPEPEAAVEEAQAPEAAAEEPSEPEQEPEAPAEESALDKLLRGRKATQTLNLPAGGIVKAGDEVVTSDGEVVVIEVTVRGAAIILDETGDLREIPAAELFLNEGQEAPEAEGSAPEESESEAAEPAITIDEIRALSNEVMRRKGAPALVRILSKHGAGRLSLLEEAKYAEAKADMEAELG